MQAEVGLARPCAGGGGGVRGHLALQLTSK